MFRVTATLQPGKDPAVVEAAVYEEIDKLKATPIAEWELDKARNNARRNAASALGSTLRRAIMLTEYAAFYDDPNLINTRTDRVLKVTAADVQRVAAKYLTKENRSVVTTMPKAGPGRGGAQ